MTRLFPRTASITVRTIAAALLLLSAATPLLLRAQAAPIPVLAARAPAPSLLSTGTVSIEATSSSITPTGTIDYTAKARVGAAPDFLQARLQVFRPNGRLIYQKTQVAAQDASGTVSFSWQRPLEGLGMGPDAYPVVLTMEARRGDITAQTRLDRRLLVYDPEHKRALVSFIARISSVPMADPQGRFVIDPGVDSKARSEAETLATAVLRNPKMRLTVGIPPSLLQEWRRISEGYEAAGASGITKVPATAPVPQAYARTLALIRQAMDTGRLELLDQPFSDPDLASLQHARLLTDIAPQYDVGVSAMFTALEVTASPGTAPANLSVPPASASRIVDQRVEYVVLDPEATKSGGGRPSSGASQVLGHRLTALLADAPASSALASQEASGVVGRVFERQVGYQPNRPMIITAELGPGRRLGAADLVAHAALLSRTPFAKLVIGRSAATKVSRPAVELIGKAAPQAPAGYWARVAESRSWSRALSNSVKQGDADAEVATTDSLMAESSSWAGPDGAWALSDRGRGFAEQAQQTAEQILDKVSLRIENVTLAGARGDVPVSVRNDSGRVLNVVLEGSGQGLQVVGGSIRRITLQPSDNFVQLPVDLKTSLQGQLTVRVIAGPRELVKQTVTVKASYLDRLAVIGGVVVVLFVLLVFIVRRVRAADQDASSDAADDDERYTDTADQPLDDDAGE